MRNKLLVLWVLIFLLTAPAVALSDCFDLGQDNSYYIKGGHTVVFYAGMMAVAKVEIPNCNLHQDSIIRLIRNYICDGDRIIVDGGECIIGTVSRAGTISF